MQKIDSLTALDALYGAVSPAATQKVTSHLTPAYTAWIEAARFCVLCTIGPEGSDASPRGDEGPVLTALSPTRLALPDWRGNNRIDSLRNIVRDPRVSLLLLVNGARNVLRINGRAFVTTDLTATFERNGRHPRSVTVIEIEEVYFQCARAILRSGLWSGEDRAASLPSAGEMLRQAGADFDTAAYDAAWAARAKETMW